MEHHGKPFTAQQPCTWSRGFFLSKLSDAALDFARRGFAIFPCRPHGKEPMTPKGFHDATADPERIRQWWATQPEANIGLPMKENGIIALDMDPRNGGRESLAVLLSEGLNVPESTPRHRTGGGGSHSFFLKPDTEGVWDVSGLRPGIDVKYDGYVVAPPSVHESGREYTVISPLDRMFLVPMPELLREAILNKTRGGRPALEGKTGGNVPTGLQHDALLRIAGWHRKEGADAEQIYRTLRAASDTWDPRPTDEDCYRIAGSVERYEPAPTKGAESLKELVKTMDANDRKELARAVREANAADRGKPPKEPKPKTARTKKPPKEPLPMPPPDLAATPPETWAQLMAWIDRHYWIATDLLREAIGLVVVATYLQEDSVSTPVLLIWGPTEAGKTQLTATCALVCYRPFPCVDPTAASIFRLIDDYPGMTLCIDEFTFNPKMIGSDPDTADVFKVLRSSFTRGAVVLRVEETDDGRKVVGYDPFGPKIVNTTRIEGLPEDFVNRSVAILAKEPPMSERWRKHIGFTDTDETKALRAAIAGVVVAAVRPLRSMDLTEFDADLRLRDMGETLCKAAAIFGKEETLLTYLRTALAERRERRLEGFNGQVLQVVSAVLEGKPDLLTLAAIRERWGDVHGLRPDEKPPRVQNMVRALRSLGLKVVSKHTRTGNITYIEGVERVGDDYPMTPEFDVLKAVLSRVGLFPVNTIGVRLHNPSQPSQDSQVGEGGEGGEGSMQPLGVPSQTGLQGSVRGRPCDMCGKPAIAMIAPAPDAIFKSARCQDHIPK